MWTLPAFCRGFFLFLCFMCEKGHHACLQPLKKCSSTAKRKAVLAVRKPSKPPKTQPEPFALPPHLQTGRTVHAEGLQGFSPCHRDQKTILFTEHCKQISPSFGTKKKLHQPKGGKINSYNRFTEICPIFPKNRQKESSSRGSEVIKFTQECNQAVSVLLLPLPAVQKQGNKRPSLEYFTSLRLRHLFVALRHDPVWELTKKCASCIKPSQDAYTCLGLRLLR